MIGFLTTPEIAATLEEQLPVYLTLGTRPVTSGEHTGKAFIPYDDDATPIPNVVEALGGLTARVDIPVEHITLTNLD